MASVTLSSDEAAVVYGTRPMLPASTGSYELVELSFEDPDFGAFGRYEDPDGILMDAYLYPIPGPDAWCPADCMLSWVNGEADEFVSQSVPELIRVGYMQEITLTSDSLVHFEQPGTSEGRHLAFQVAVDGRAGRSDYLVVGIDGYRVKVRSTRFEDDSNGGDALGFFRSVVADVTPAYRCSGRVGSDERTIELQQVVGAPIERVAPLIDSVLVADGFEPKSRRNAWTSVPRFDWPSGIPESERRGGFPGYQLLATVEPRADSTQYTVSVPAVCEPHPSGNEQLSLTVQALVTASVVKALGEALEDPR